MARVVGAADIDVLQRMVAEGTLRMVVIHAVANDLIDLDVEALDQLQRAVVIQTACGKIGFIVG